jgi:hypothetical protein
MANWAGWFGKRQPDADPTVSETQVEKQPPPDGTTSTCHIGEHGGCGNEIRYSSARQRWEHTSRGNAACFRK